MNSHAQKRLLLVFSLILTAWGVALFFQSAYFAAFFYGVTPPWWTQWVGQLPVVWLNVVDTIMAGILVAAIVISARSGRKHHRERKLSRSSRAAASSWVWLAVGLFLLVAFLGALGFNLAGLGTWFMRFVTGH